MERARDGGRKPERHAPNGQTTNHKPHKAQVHKVRKTPPPLTVRFIPHPYSQEPPRITALTWQVLDLPHPDAVLAGASALHLERLKIVVVVLSYRLTLAVRYRGR